MFVVNFLLVRRNGSLEHPTRTSSQGSNKAGRTARMAESPTGLSPKVDRRSAVSADREVNGKTPCSAVAPFQNAVTVIPPRLAEDKAIFSVAVW